jgi:hypothetical protein
MHPSGVLIDVRPPHQSAVLGHEDSHRYLGAGELHCHVLIPLPAGPFIPRFATFALLGRRLRFGA